jgi:hypothetical protein
MKTMCSILPLFIGLLWLGWAAPGMAQSSEKGEEMEEEPFRPHHNITLVINHANVREGVAEGRNRWLALPGWGLNYDFRFHPRWAIGLHTDLITEEFKVSRHIDGEEGEVIDRNFPVAPALIGSFFFGKRRRWGVVFGPGVELSSGESFFLTRAGMEYAYELPKGWELVAEFAYDIKWDAYDSLAFGLGISKSFGYPRDKD